MPEASIAPYLTKLADRVKSEGIVGQPSVRRSVLILRSASVHTRSTSKEWTSASSARCEEIHFPERRLNSADFDRLKILGEEVAKGALLLRDRVNAHWSRQNWMAKSSRSRRLAPQPRSDRPTGQIPAHTVTLQHIVHDWIESRDAAHQKFLRRRLSASSDRMPRLRLAPCHCHLLNSAPPARTLHPRSFQPEASSSHLRERKAFHSSARSLAKDPYSVLGQ
jgi:hypothetical protein